MSIKFPLMSILSVAFLAFFMLQGGDVQLHSIEIGFHANSQGATVTIDPEWLVWSDRLYPQCSGETFGNVAVVWRPFRGSDRGAWVQRFELNHIIQYHAIGWFVYPAKYILPIDPMYYQPKRLDDPGEADEVEWLPPKGWMDQWHFISFSVHAR